jgi:uncharacterized repeat protein (TIGR03803 family)
MPGKKLCLRLTLVLATFSVNLLLAGTNAAAQTETILHSFNNNGADGIQPKAGLISDAAGNLYGTTYTGGAYNFGSVFELSPKAGGTWTETILHSFKANGVDGYNPISTLVFDRSGSLYGTTENGGSYLYGTAFELSPVKGGGWSERVLHHFGSDSADDGWFPTAGLIIDKSYNLYGTTGAGGLNGLGAVFQLSPGANGAWTETTLHSFSGGSTDGGFPMSGLILDAAGNLYGTTYNGGTYGTGTAFKLTPSAGGSWTETVLFSFNNGNDGSDEANTPYDGLTSDASGNLYGTGYLGGTRNAGGVFELTPDARGTWTGKLLHSFGTQNADGYSPMGGVSFDAAGNLYGTTYDGGAHGYGAVFELIHNADGSWTEKTLHSFNVNGGDGYNPYAGVILGSGGILYGTTGGGLYGQGTVFSVKP